MTSKTKSTSPAVLAEDGWASLLAATTSAFLFFSGLTGLVVYLAPFSRVTQVALLVHVGVGLALVLPLIVYAWRHVGTWAKQKVTASMFLGYALLVAVLVALATGILGTGYALFRTRLPETLDLVHLVSGIAGLALVVSHLISALARRRVSAQRTPPLRSAMKRFAQRATGLTIAALAIVAAGAFLLPSRTTASRCQATTPCQVMPSSSTSTAATRLHLRFARTVTSRWSSPSSWRIRSRVAQAGVTNRFSLSGNRAPIASRR